MSRVSAPWPLGRKQIYLPSFTLTLLRTPHLPAKYATFKVPLTFNKFDLRDYLLHMYNVRVVSVRSWIVHSRARMDREDARFPRRRWYKGRGEKKMMVELEREFVWPKEIEDFSEWNKETMDKLQAWRKEESKYGPQDAPKMPVRADHKKSLAQQAKDLLEGKVKWKSGVSNA